MTPYATPTLDRAILARIEAGERGTPDQLGARILADRPTPAMLREQVLARRYGSWERYQLAIKAAPALPLFRPVLAPSPQGRLL